MVLAIGLTGLLGSGKSTAAHYFKTLDVGVLSADLTARALTAPHTETLKTIIEHFGKRFLNADQSLNRKQLGEYIFQHPIEREFLEKLLHPLIKKKLATELETIKTPYAIVEIPLLFKRSDFPFIDRILLISAADHIRVERTQLRDGTSSKTIQAIINAQPTFQSLKEIADDWIRNESTTDHLKENIIKLHEQYLNLAKTF